MGSRLYTCVLRGGNTITREFNKAAFVDCSDFVTIDDLADYLLELEHDRNALETMLKTPVLLKDSADDNELRLFLRKIVEKPEDRRIQRLSAVSDIARKQEQMYGKGI